MTYQFVNKHFSLKLHFVMIWSLSRCCKGAASRRQTGLFHAIARCDGSRQQLGCDEKEGDDREPIYMCVCFIYWQKESVNEKYMR